MRTGSLGALVVASAALCVPAEAQQAAPLFPGLLHATGLHPSGIAAADFNLDGHLDLAVANSGSDDVSVLLGDGTGNFGAQSRFPVGDGPTLIAAGDWNGDTRPDLVTVNVYSHDLSVLIATDAGKFGPASTLDVDTFGLCIVPADINGDDHVDLLTTLRDHKGLAVLCGDGHGGFASPTVYATNVKAQYLTLGDLNGDGHADALVTGGYREAAVTLLLADGHGSFQSPSEVLVAPARYPALVDVNADGALDLLFSGLSSSISVALNLGGMRFSRAAPTDVHGFVVDLDVVEWNDDGRPDLLLPGMFGANVFAGDGRGGFVPGFMFSATGSAGSVAAGDFDADGHTDFAVTDSVSGVAVLLGQGADGARARNYWAALRAGDVACGDVNDDEKMDVVLLSSDQLVLCAGDGLGGLAAGVPLATHRAPQSLAIVDVDGDTKLDIASSTLSLDVSVLVNGKLAPPASETSLVETAQERRAWPPASLATGDIDGDGDMDCVVSGGMATTIVRGDGHGHFGSPVGLGGTENLACVALVDLDQDWRLDIVGGDDAAQRVLRWLQARDGTFGKPDVIASQAGAEQLVVNDFNEDGHADIATVGSPHGMLRLFLGDGRGGFRGPLGLPATDLADCIATGDLDGDGHADLVVPVSAQPAVRVMRGDGTGHFASESYLAGPGILRLALGDLDGDDRLDIITANGSSITVLLQQRMPTNR